MNERIQRLFKSDGIGAWQHAAVFLAVCALLVARRPDAVSHPQFWAEDGRVWYAEAYNLGWWTALFRTWTGYFLTLPRLGAGLALLLPFLHAPLLLNLIAIAIQALPVNLMLSSRSADWGSLGTRALLAATYVALPSSPEIHANITNSQWPLAFSAFLLIVAHRPRGVAERVFDVALLLLSGSTGPFCFFLFPIASYIAYRDRARWRLVPVCIMAACSVVQAVALLFVSPTARAEWGALGATPALLVRILSGNIFLGALIGANHLAIEPGAGFFVFLLLVAVGGSVFLVATFFRSPLNLRLFIILAYMMLAASLISPSSYAPPGTTRWQLVAGASAVRYWFLPTLAFVWSMITAFQSRGVVLKSIAAALIFLLCFGAALRWRRTPLQDFHFSQEAARFEAAPLGAEVVIPLNPEGWTMRLLKHADR
jgi:hypothetical protein